jgi:hypothetical protein
MHAQATFGRLPPHQIAWSAVNSLLWMPGLSFAVMGFFRWFGTSIVVVNPNRAFLISGLAVFALLFAVNIAGKLTGGLSLYWEVDKICCADPALSSSAKVGQLFRNWIFYLQLFVLAIWLVAVLVKTTP